jgi:hypothetical protein
MKLAKSIRNVKPSAGFEPRSSHSRRSKEKFPYVNLGEASRIFDYNPHKTEFAQSTLN